MDYPEYLLPKPSYDRHITFDGKESIPLYLVRHTHSKDIKDEYGRLKSDYVNLRTGELKDYSTNLLGVFKADDCIISAPLQSSPNYHFFERAWQRSEKVLVPTFQVDFNVKEERGRFYLRVSNFHLKEFGPTDECPPTPYCKVLHTPTNTNFWHCSIRWYCDGKDSEQWEDKKLKRMRAVMRAFIIKFAEFDLPEYETLDPSNYCSGL